MHTHPRLIQISALALGIAGAMAFSQAHAAAFLLKENSVKAQGRAMAGAASAKGDASVVANNPAVMSTFQSTTFQADINAIDLSFEFSGGGSAAAGTPLAQPLRGGAGGDAGGLEPVPAMSFIKPLGGQFEYVTIGAMVSAPFGLKTDYESDWVGRYHTLESDIRIIDLTLAASLDLSDRFSVGVGLVYEHADVTLSNAVDFGSAICRINIAACITPTPQTAMFGPQKNDGSVSVNGTDNSFGWILGFNWRPTDSLSFGYAHRSEVDHELRGTGDFTVPGEIRATLDGAGMGALYQDGSAGAELVLPSTDTFSATWDVNDRLSLMAEASLAGWDSLKEVRIEFDNSGQPDAAEDYSWKDSWFYSIGAEYRLNDRWTLRGGIARDDSPVSLPHRTPRMPDQDRMWYSLGATWAMSDSFDITASYSRIQLVDTPVVGIASSSGSYLAGDYDGGANVFGVSGQFRF